MKKILLFSAASLALCAVSCTQESVESTSVASTSTSTIGFMSNTSRASVLTLSDIQDDSDGFVVYGVLTGATSWHDDMDGNNTYIYGDDSWAWNNNSPEWPSDSESYPINFYAYYTTEELGDTSGITLTNGGITNLTLSYEAPTTGQTDILVATATANARPSGDRLPLVFNHILSKAAFSFTIGEKMTMHTQSLGFNNICSDRIYDIIGSAWDSQDESGTDNYPYLITTEPALKLDASNSSFDGTYGDLMLLPQTTDTWDTSTDVEGSHIYMIYRAEYDGDVNAIGYEDAANHPDYDPDNADMSKYDGEPLFVLVGYPLGDSSFVLEEGNSYTYNLSMGGTDSSNGYLLDDVYYDKDGNPTDFQVEGKDVGDPISDGYINFTVSVESWVENTTTIE